MYISELMKYLTNTSIKRLFSLEYSISYVRGLIYNVVLTLGPIEDQPATTTVGLLSTHLGSAVRIPAVLAAIRYKEHAK